MFLTTMWIYSTINCCSNSQSFHPSNLPSPTTFFTVFLFSFSPYWWFGINNVLWETWWRLDNRLVLLNCLWFLDLCKIKNFVGHKPWLIFLVGVIWFTVLQSLPLFMPIPSSISTLFYHVHYSTIFPYFYSLIYLPFRDFLVIIFSVFLSIDLIISFLFLFFLNYSSAICIVLFKLVSIEVETQLNFHFFGWFSLWLFVICFTILESLPLFLRSKWSLQYLPLFRPHFTTSMWTIVPYFYSLLYLSFRDDISRLSFSVSSFL